MSHHRRHSPRRSEPRQANSRIRERGKMAAPVRRALGRCLEGAAGEARLRPRSGRLGHRRRRLRKANQRRRTLRTRRRSGRAVGETPFAPDDVALVNGAPATVDRAGSTLGDLSGAFPILTQIRGRASLRRGPIGCIRLGSVEPLFLRAVGTQAGTVSLSDGRRHTDPWCLARSSPGCGACGGASCLIEWLSPDAVAAALPA
jgi:hypothetical protein